MFVALSTVGVVVLAVAAIAVLVVLARLLLGQSAMPQGRAAERMTDQGNVVREPPGFRKPPGDDGLL
jgi:hypothetical protein